jgi:hypothetical protein
MVVLNSRGLAKETRGASSLCLRTMNPSMDVDPSSVNGETDSGKIKCIHASEAGGQGHRPSHVEAAAPARVPTFDPHDQAVPGCACQLFVS